MVNATEKIQALSTELSSPERVLLRAEGVQKSFNGVPALVDGRLTLKAGTVHALCGGNGAGKSTFLNITMGLLRRDGGTVEIDGEQVDFKSAADALRQGIAIITQELSPVPEMTVAENLYLGREPKRLGVFVDFGQMSKDAQAFLDELGFEVDARKKMGELSLAQVQLVEIAKALSYRAHIVIMDEPTSAIGEHEVHVLFNALRKITARGSAIIYVSHKLTEIFEIADEYTVFRDGRFIETGNIKDIDRRHLVTQIVGREVKLVEKGKPLEDAPILLSVSNLARGSHFRDISLEVASGEVVGIYGLLGSGRTEFLETIFGLHSPTGGEVVFNGGRVKPGSPKEAIQRGMAMVTEDRKDSGLVLSASIAHNITLSSLALMAVSGFIRGDKERSAVKDMIASQRIKSASPDVAVETLSGGNQQKVVLARCLLTNPKLLICDEPTRGIDEGSKQEIYAFLRDFAAKGNGVLVVSSEAPEIMQLSDRIAIFKQGQLVNIIDGAEASQQTLMDLAS
ncbi:MULTISPECIES: sugar ABC transporter ATP-binding protein [Rhizobium]|uniref:Putative xylitol transport system ATP-binding protein n=1 Tax=Rhizobium fabae TaxID=573179 RepID=A0A7W6BDV2_9HYPH|nr:MULTISPECIES: sugar ABC transporter ATP-binding protein [Rhizobium]MBB3917147.1 putative xylitol transport system ATP-binding protein [Rhizobium fabae]PDT27030.1 D-xylose ABC transporter ATP-binding protein [Rhizobium sp. L9]RUM10370.1 sugar ABC transporter ATP-binding protein [Rhizobium fabae]